MTMPESSTVVRRDSELRGRFEPPCDLTEMIGIF